MNDATKAPPAGPVLIPRLGVVDEVTAPIPGDDGVRLSEAEEEFAEMLHRAMWSINTDGMTTTVHTYKSDQSGGERKC